MLGAVMQRNFNTGNITCNMSKKGFMSVTACCLCPVYCVFYVYWCVLCVLVCAVCGLQVLGWVELRGH